MIMKKLGTLVCTLFMVLGLAGSSFMPLHAEEEVTGEGDLLQEIIDRGELVVATSPDYPPYEFIDTTKQGQEQYVGSDIEMAKYIANALGVKLTIKAMDFDSVISSLPTKQADMALAGLTYTPERSASMDMTDPYYDEDGEESWQGMIILKDKKDTYKSFQDLKGKKVAVQAGSLQDLYIKDQLKDVTVQYVSQVPDAITLLKNGSVDAVASAYGAAREYEKKNDEIYVSKDLLFTLKEEYLGVRIGVPKGETKFLNKVNDIIKDVREQKLFSGWYQAATNYSNGDKIEGNFFMRTVQIAGRYWPQFVEGLLITLGLAFVTVLLGTLFGALFALIKLSKNPIVKFVSGLYVELIRGTPLLLQLWLFVAVFAQLSGGKVPMIVSVVIALIVNSSAYVAEIIRGGILSVDKGQREAAKSLGMSNTNTMVKIILPQAIKNILPALGNEFIMMVKETSLASCFYIGELMTVNNIIKTSTYLSIETLVVVGLIYFVVTFALSKAVNLMERRMRVSD